MMLSTLSLSVSDIFHKSKVNLQEEEMVAVADRLDSGGFRVMRRSMAALVDKANFCSLRKLLSCYVINHREPRSDGVKCLMKGTRSQQ